MPELPPRFRFKWDGSKGVDEANMSRRIPLWEVLVLEWPLERWRWVTTPETLRHNPHHQIDLPEKIVTAIVRILNVDHDYVMTGDPLEECSTLVARSWKGLWQGFQTDLTWSILQSSFSKNTVNLRFIITVRKDAAISGAGCTYEAECILQQTRTP
ncbi:uncharacterized protein Z519_09734 [Cladophialophora bantiana CBS 173.52]|uniref:F-box domain-containing protein n=1 Tax=Cladophialophora bantiana (strain ATCC 10958 / CBS 173.52 / CDC B-1940 / NIH 8579) TaxID=1442370 RepID=A0A0D2H8M0_CLAB1|nr:uncharacterized protein Z519_09734 [Cladophialophora bantiana CBS 173.52]KIW89578.1 hypothetical protein Z519_09734 [Cladophialophora bantiana CBS 173.52]